MSTNGFAEVDSLPKANMQSTKPVRASVTFLTTLGLGLAMSLTLAINSRAVQAAPADAVPVAKAAGTACPALLQRSALRLQDEKPQNLCQYAGDVVLIVNTASFCGFTPQYKSLEALYAKYRSKGLVVLGFPSNDFSQEPGSNKEIADFCDNTFSVKFPMFTKTRVAGGSGIDPLFIDLAKQTGAAPEWNFHKYLMSRDGRTVISRASDMDPANPAFVKEVERLLAMP
jgi:glutathione peroxidase